ncbi:MAG TPA: hypothetical protein DD400_04990 [Rhodospirillaceae bacterium]|nr:hypothetical protein [Rhodospirillaceae bacterium]
MRHEDRFVNAIIVVDSEETTHDWNGDPNLLSAYKKSLHEILLPYENQFDRGLPNVVMMTTHQAMDELTPNNGDITKPLLVIVHDERKEKKFGGVYAEGLLYNYMEVNRQDRSLPPVLLPFFFESKTATLTWPSFRDAVLETLKIKTPRLPRRENEVSYGYPIYGLKIA